MDGDPSLFCSPESHLWRTEIPVTDTVSLRRLSVEDAEAMFELVERDQAHLRQYENRIPELFPTLQAVEAFTGQDDPPEHRFGIWEGDTFMGCALLTQWPNMVVEIGYWLGSEYRGKGHMTRTVVALTRYATESLGYPQVVARVHKHNKASQAVLARAGYMRAKNDRLMPKYNILFFNTEPS